MANVTRSSLMKIKSLDRHKGRKDIKYETILKNHKNENANKNLNDDELVQVFPFLY
jgi:hypothetical protein